MSSPLIARRGIIASRVVADAPPGGTWDAEIAADAPVRWWKLEEASGNFVDEIAAASATVTGTPTYSQAGLVDDAVSFGSGQHAAATGYAGWTGDYTVNAIIKIAPGSGTGFRGVTTMGSGTDTGIYIRNGGPMFYSNGIRGSGPDIRDGEWHLIAVRSNSTDGGKLYLDGAQVASWATHYTDGTATITIARGRGSESLIGVVDEIVYFNDDVGEARVLAHAATVGFP